MAGARGRLHKPAKVPSNATPRRSTRGQDAPGTSGGASNTYNDLLSEAKASKAAGPDEDSKPLKRRRITTPGPAADSDIVAGPSNQVHESKDLTSEPQAPPLPPAPAPTSSRPVSGDENGGHRMRQTIEASDDSDSDDSDFEWEDALAGGDDEDEENAEEGADREVGDVMITFGGEQLEEQERGKKAKRRGITFAERKWRLSVHKMHILCLLYHVHRRNAWCNDEKVQAALRTIPSTKALSNLVPNPDYSQFETSKRFIAGMQELSHMWSKRFSVTALGMHKPRWTDADAKAPDFSEYQHLDDPMDREEFRKAARRLHGSQDLGAQLFCALLRGIGVEARLVCSLQCLSLTYTPQPSTPSKQGSKNVIHLDPFNREENTTTPPKVRPTNASHPKRLTRLERVLGERNPKLSAGVAPKQQKKYHTPYPVYWVEVFNQALQKWVPIDPLSTATVDKPDKLEPPLNYSQNALTYVVAFDEDQTVKDVTRRYAKAYNAKTRKQRVEYTEGGAKWWRQALRPFKRTIPLDRDQVEDAALARKEASEGMPKNVQDFKDHPIYVLERHLRHNEVIHPKHQVGKVNVASAMNPKMEPIYRRGDVHVVRSADKWYRMGRDVKAGEQPLKHAKPRRGARGRSVHLETEMDVDDLNDEIGAALYAVFQTELYVPPPVVNGRVPRNHFGNLDLYVPSMVPPGGAHIRHKLAAKAARILGVDSADAVTGSSFKGRHGTAVVQGVVVAQEYAEAVEAVIDGIEYAQEEAENAARSAEALRLWRRFVLGLKIAQRVNAIEIDGERGPTVDVQAEIEKEDKLIAEQQLAGGFFMEEGVAAEPTGHRRSAANNDFGGGFLPDEYERGGGFVPEVTNDGGGFMPEDSNEGGGFLLEDSHGSGGFLPEDVNEGGGFIPEAPTDTLPSTEPPRPLQDAELDDGISSRAEHGVANTSRSSPHTSEIPQRDNTADDFGGGSIPEDALMEDASSIEHPVAEHQTSQEVETGLTQDQGQAAVLDQEETTEQLSSTKLPILSETFSDKGEPAHADEHAPPTSSPSEAGSLPLEDPEDEDADPDWLVDVT